MAPPTVSLISPNSGLTVGDVFVVVTGSGFVLPSAGKSMRVKFGGVLSPRVGVTSATRLMCLAPPAAPGVVDVLVENVTPGAPEVVEGTTVVGGFTYKRPDVSTPGNLSNHPEVALVSRAIVQELRNKVLLNSHHVDHGEYADATDASAGPGGQEAQAEAPSIKIVGPIVTEDRTFEGDARGFYDSGNGIDFIERDGGARVLLDFTAVGVGRTGSEARNLHRALTRWLRRTPVVSTTLYGNAETFEVEPVMDARADFRPEATRENVFQFTARFLVRGLLILADWKLWESKRVEGEVVRTVYRKTTTTPGP